MVKRCGRSREVRGESGVEIEGGRQGGGRSSLWSFKMWFEWRNKSFYHAFGLIWQLRRTVAEYGIVCTNTNVSAICFQPWTPNVKENETRIFTPSILCKYCCKKQQLDGVRLFANRIPQIEYRRPLPTLHYIQSVSMNAIRWLHAECIPSSECETDQCLLSGACPRVHESLSLCLPLCLLCVSLPEVSRETKSGCAR